MLTDYRVRQREYLLKISRALTAQLDLTAVLRMILEAAGDLLNGHAGLIILPAADAAQPSTSESSYRVRVSFGIPAQLIQYLKPLWENGVEINAAQLGRHLRRINRTPGLRLQQVVALQMHIREQSLGMIYIFRSSGGFTTIDRQVLEAFRDQASIAVNNARLYEQVTEEKRRLDAILEGSADGVMILDPSFRLTMFNRALVSLTGWATSDAIGKHHDKVLILRNKRDSMTLNEAAAGGWPLAGSGPLYVEGDLQRRDGSLVSVGITYAPLFSPNGQLVNVIGNVRDITRFREADQLKNTFISIISHELKTPVALIKGYAGTLSREDTEWDPDTVRASARIIEEESDRLTALIDNLLDASRLQAGGLKLNLTDVALDKLAQRQIELFRTQTTKHELLAEFEPSFPLIQGDAARLEQLLNNLVSNAIKYAPDGGPIRVSGRTLADAVEVTVSDQGIGISVEEQASIFKRFYRVDDALSRRAQGSGLGLFIAHAIVEAHGGRIWVNSAPTQGSAFTFSLPRE